MTQTNRQAIETLGMDVCRKPILNALQQAVDVSGNSKRRVDSWEWAMKEIEKEDWFSHMVLGNWYRSDKSRYDQSIRQMKRLTFLLDEADGKVEYQSVDITALKERIDMTDLVSRYGVELRRNGNHSKASCPFHNEKTPSFHVYKDHSFCYGCQRSDDAISFVQEMENCDFRQALKILGGTV